MAQTGKHQSCQTRRARAFPRGGLQTPMAPHCKRNGSAMRTSVSGRRTVRTPSARLRPIPGGLPESSPAASRSSRLGHRCRRGRGSCSRYWISGIGTGSPRTCRAWPAGSLTPKHTALQSIHAANRASSSPVRRTSWCPAMRSLMRRLPRARDQTQESIQELLTHRSGQASLDHAPAPRLGWTQKM